MRDEAGFALVMLLIFVNILSEVILSMMSSVMFSAKTLENFAVYSRYVHMADIALEQAKQDILEGNIICFQNECAVQKDFLKNRETLTYKVNFLETAPCFKIKAAEKSGADFFKIVVKVTNHNRDVTAIESTFVKAAQISGHCHQMLKLIEPGFLSWRLTSPFEVNH